MRAARRPKCAEVTTSGKQLRKGSFASDYFGVGRVPSITSSCWGNISSARDAGEASPFMRIECVEAILVAYPEPEDFKATRQPCLARLASNDDRVGWGEAITVWKEATVATRKVIEGLAPLVIGRAPIESATIWQTLQGHTSYYGRGEITSFAISPINIGVWALKGKACDQPILKLKLICGPVRERLPAIDREHAPKQGRCTRDGRGRDGRGSRRMACKRLPRLQVRHG